MLKTLSHSCVRGTGNTTWNCSSRHVRIFCSPLRTVHSDSTSSSSTRKSTDAIESFPHRQFTIQVLHPERKNKAGILDSLSSARPTERALKYAYRDRRQAVVVLATPSFTSWLEEGDQFLSKLLDRIVNPVRWTDEPTGTEIDVVCACVDGLSPSTPWNLSSRQGIPSEGISVFCGPSDHVIPDLWEADEGRHANSSEKLSSLTFNQRSRGFRITLPLANTLFKNGRHSTLLASKWYSDGRKCTQTHSQVEKLNVAIEPFDDTALQFHIPAEFLTERRKIEAGLGNIIRSIDFGGEGRSGPASRELETSVARYLDQNDDSGPVIDVWALITPKELNTDLPTGNLAPKSHLPSGQAKTPAGLQTLPEVQHLISSGAKLCRVLSGGGGWGAKQGLLSLDPQTYHGAVSEAWLDFAGDSEEVPQISALGNIAHAGSNVQFFTAKKSRTPGSKPAYEVGSTTSKNHLQRTTIIGTAPSSVDEVPVSPSTELSDQSDGIVFQPGHFSCVSESGMFLKQAKIPTDSTKIANDRNQEFHFTKLDVPYSYVYQDIATSSVYDDGNSQKIGR